MQTEEIIRMAREAGFDVEEGLFPFEATEDKYIGTSYNLERFAALVAAHERETCAKVCDDLHHWAASCCAKDIRARGDK